MAHRIKSYKEYKGIPITRDYNVYGEQVYIGNGQGCRTFWFSTAREAHGFIDKLQVTLSQAALGYLNLIPPGLCQECTNHYSVGTSEWKNAKRDNCQDYKDEMKTLKKGNKENAGRKAPHRPY